MSVAPALFVAAVHLRLEKSAERALDCPAYTVTLLLAALDDDLRLHDDVDVDPDCVPQDLAANILSSGIFL